MKIFRSIWIPLTILLLWLLLTWLLGGWIGLPVPRLYYLRGGLWIIGVVGFVGYLLLRPKTNGSGAQPGVSAGELDDNFSEASKRLQTAGVKQMAGMPAVFFLGDTDTAKTSIIAKSDIAQLLAGQAQQDVAIVPTRAVNFWLAQNTIFVDPAGGLLADPDNRKRLFKKFSVMALKSVMGSRKLPTRSVVFTVDCGTLLQKGGADAMAVKARQFQTILAELAHEMGSRFPVYVLFTKTDKLSYFRDFVENLTEQEAAEVFGVTLPLETHQGVYHQQQTARITDAFQQLYYSLADRRATYLSREHKPMALPNIYEFPREFSKLRNVLTSFLVDLCRPSQLGISPFLRGFYFTGIRALTVNDVAPAPLQVQQEDGGGMDSGATQMFRPRERNAPLAAEERETSARKVAQWVYLPHLLPGVILADNAANSIGNNNVKLNVARRILFCAAIAAALLMGIWWTVSYTNNRALVHGALDAAQGAPSVPSLDALQRLTKVKETLEKLNYFEENGRPLSYGAFLYSGDDARESVRKAYYGLFRKLLLAPTQERLVQVCTSPSDAQPQRFLYDALKSYLVTTEYHAKSVPEFLTPTLLLHWNHDKKADTQTEQLAKQNFDFYSRELLNHNEYWPQTTADAAAVGNCRDYLNRLGQTDRIYRAILTDAGTGIKPIIFNVDYPGTEVTVVNRYRVDPPFTKNGFNAFQDSLKNLKKYSNGDDWVLGPKSAGTLDQGKLSLELQRLYTDDFVKIWRTYLQATNVLHPQELQEAITKLDTLSGNHSPLLQALCVASENTAVQNKEITDVFQPVQAVTPPGCTQSLVGGSASTYMPKLLALQQALKAIEVKKAETYNPAKNAAADTTGTVTQIAYGFKGPTDEVVKKILLAPIYFPVPPKSQDANSLAATMCGAINPALSKYPFNPNSHDDLSFDDLNKFLKKPDGSFWATVNDPKMKPYLKEIGDKFVASDEADEPLLPQYVAFLNKVANLAHVLYPKDGQAPGFTFIMKPGPSDIVDHVVAKINGQNLSIDGKGRGTTEPFSWPGTKDGVQVDVQWVGGSKFDLPDRPGLWGLWHFIDLGKEIPGIPVEFKWVQEVGGVPVTVAQKPAEIHFTFDPTAAQVLRTRFFKLTCVSKAN